MSYFPGLPGYGMDDNERRRRIAQKLMRGLPAGSPGGSVTGRNVRRNVGPKLTQLSRVRPGLMGLLGIQGRGGDLEVSPGPGIPIREMIRGAGIGGQVSGQPIPSWVPQVPQQVAAASSPTGSGVGDYPNNGYSSPQPTMAPGGPIDPNTAEMHPDANLANLVRSPAPQNPIYYDPYMDAYRGPGYQHHYRPFRTIQR